MFGCPAAETNSELSTGSAVGSELIGSCGHETGVNQAGRYSAAEQTTLLTATASSDTMVISSVQNISSMTETSKENGVIAVTHQHTTKVRADSSKYNCNSASEPMNPSNRATDKEPNSMLAYVNEHFDISDQHKDYGHMDLPKVNSVSFISDMETKPLYFSDCDTESEFCMSIINKDVECNLKASLMSVLKKQVGESASQILAPYALGFVKNEIDCMMQELMVKVLSSVMLNETKQKNLNSDLQFGDAHQLMITSMVQEWKKEMLLVTNKRKAEKEKKMEAALDRVRKLGQRVSTLCGSNTTSTQSSACSSSSDDNSANYNDENISCVAGDCNKETAEKSTIMQDILQLLNISDCQMVETPKSVSEQESQTISTGCILYLKCLSDL